MKVLMMHHNDGLVGGAQIQMNRLRRGLIGTGIDARVLCREGGSGDAVRMPRLPVAERWLGAAGRRLGLNDVHLAGSFLVSRMPEVREADVLDLHCLHSGTFSYLALPRLTAAKPVVFSFHDMWPVTGHCHASLECERWKSGCGRCPHLDVEPAVRRDATAWEWRLKRRAYRKSAFTIVVPSRWLAARVRESMLAGFPVRHIPHGVDVETFRPLGRADCRGRLGIPADKLVLLCVIDRMDRPLKGADLLAGVLEHLPEALRRRTVLVTMGRAAPSALRAVPMPVINLGYVEEDSMKAAVYGAADLLINPSRAESFGLAALESLACGLPVVAFAVGATPELVKPEETGALAEAGDVREMAMRVSSLLEDAETRGRLGHAGRGMVRDQFRLEFQVRRYAALYRELCGRHGEQGD